VFGGSDYGTGVLGISQGAGAAGVHGACDAVNSVGVSGSSQSGTGVIGTSSGSSGVGVGGVNNAGVGAVGVSGSSTSGTGVRGSSSGGTAVHGVNLGGGGLAGRFEGNVSVTGLLSKPGGQFLIDHPLDPRNRYLAHSFVESPDMMNIYNGDVVLDRDGSALVELPAWFGALNRDFRYGLAPIGSPGPDLHIADVIVDNRFRIAGGTQGMKVSWQVTGIRRDPYADAHRVVVEADKPLQERGRCLYPELYPELHPDLDAEPSSQAAVTTPATPGAASRDVR
jgi:hypothetical protein